MKNQISEAEEPPRREAPMRLGRHFARLPEPESQARISTRPEPSRKRKNPATVSIDTFCKGKISGAGYGIQALCCIPRAPTDTTLPY